MPQIQEDLSTINQAIDNVIITSTDIQTTTIGSDLATITSIHLPEPDWDEQDQNSLRFVKNKEKFTPTATNLMDIQTNTDGSLDLMTGEGLKQIKVPNSYFKDKLTFEVFKKGMYYDIGTTIKFRKKLWISLTPMISKLTPNNSAQWKKITESDFIEKECYSEGNRLSCIITAQPSVNSTYFTVTDLWDLCFISEDLLTPNNLFDLKHLITNYFDGMFKVEPSYRDFPLEFIIPKVTALTFNLHPLEIYDWELGSYIEISLVEQGIDILKVKYIHNSDGTVEQIIKKRENTNGDYTASESEVVTTSSNISDLVINQQNLNTVTFMLYFSNQTNLNEQDKFNPTCEFNNLSVLKGM